MRARIKYLGDMMKEGNTRSETFGASGTNEKPVPGKQICHYRSIRTACLGCAKPVHLVRMGDGTYEWQHDGIPTAEMMERHRERGEMEVSRICYTDSGFYFNNSRSTNRKRRKMRGITYHYGDRVKRSKPQVLDADGVPIEIGDKVWLLPGEHCKAFPLYGFKAGVEYTVSENESAIHKENGRICITKGNCIYGYPMPEQVTHHEPNTQERIDEDALKEPCVYFNHETGGCQSCPAFEKYDCNVHKSLDLLRRQRELDGRDA